MRGVTITDNKDDGRLLSFDLSDILRLLGPAAADGEWEISGVECVGGAAAEELHRLAEAKARVAGQTLLTLAAGVTQVIDSVFTGFRAGEDHPWVIILAVDSSAFDVQSDDENILASVKQRFRDLTEFSAAGPSPQTQKSHRTRRRIGPKLAGR